MPLRQVGELNDLADQRKKMRETNEASKKDRPNPLCYLFPVQ